uniref:STAS domain-containing protein n=1 Tax=Trichobilharzia regenti TaxID=157069 RepID=A0AA85ITX3_TRIRE|nr:unnamed protein product [Trichobilharzia regenti]
MEINEDDKASSIANGITPFISLNRPLLTKEKYNQYADYNVHSSPSLPIWRRTLLIFISCIRSLIPLNTSEYNTSENVTSDKLISQSRDEKLSNRDKCQHIMHHFGRCMFNIFPFLRTLYTYKVKSCLFSDIIAGFTVGIMHVPQGMAYALVATLPPVYGLYTSFFPALVYFFLGTSRHISIGTMAVVSLLTGDFLDRVILEANFNEKQLGVNSTNITSQIMDKEKLRIDYATALAFTVGVIQFIMGLLRLGGLIRYFSVPMTSGFTVGVAVHVFTSQVKNVLGLKLPRFAGVFTIPLTYVAIFRNIQYANIPTLLLSGVCITILAVYKDWISPKVMKFSKIPIPVDLIIVILSTIVSYFLDLNGKYNVAIIGKVSKGIEHPKIPNISLMGAYIGDGFITAIIAISVSISLSRIFATRFHYKINTNKELIAFGVSNTISSFFHTFPASASLSRSAVLVSAGGRTQVSSLFSCLLLVLVLCFIGPLFYTVPTCCLSAIILVALKGMFLEAKDFITFWKFSLWDSLVWLLTFLCTVFLSVNYGLLLGVIVSALSVILRTQWPKLRTLGQTPNTEIYQDCKQYNNCTQYDQIKIIRYEGNLYYVCAEHFREAVYQQTGVNPVDIYARVNKYLNKIKAIEKSLCNYNLPETTDVESIQSVANLNTVNKGNRNLSDQDTLPDKSPNGHSELYKGQNLPESTSKKKNPLHHFLRKKPLTLEEKVKLEVKKKKITEKLRLVNQSLTFKFLIIDCSCWTFIDIVGADELKQVIDGYNKLGVTVMIAQMKDSLINTLKNNKKFADSTTVYPTVHDAVIDALNRLQTMEVAKNNVIKVDSSKSVTPENNTFSFVDVMLTDISRRSSTKNRTRSLSVNSSQIYTDTQV